MRTKIVRYLVGAAVCAIAPTAARAQTAPPSAPASATPAAPATGEATLGEIVVTATRTGESKAQATPIALTVLSADTLSAAGAVNTKDLVELTPNLKIAQALVNPEIYIRGVGTNNFQIGSDPDVTTQVDGIYISRPYAQLNDFLDVQRIEVLRGPQGTLYGRNAVGGTINIISRLPNDTFQAQTAVEAGDYSLAHVQGYVSGPLVNGLLDGSVALTYTSHSDYVENIDPGQKGLGNANHGGIRGQLLYKPLENLQAITRVDYNRNQEREDSYDHLTAPVVNTPQTPAAVANTPLANSVIGDYHKAAVDTPQDLHLEIYGVSEEINYTLNNIFSVKSLSAFRHSMNSLDNDTGATEAAYNFSHQQDLDNTWSQEFDLNVHYDRLSAVAGLFYLSEHEVAVITANVRPQAVGGPAAAAFNVLVNPISDVQSRAAFVQGTYAVLDNLHVTAGIRYTDDRKSVQQVYNKTSPSGAPLLLTPAGPVSPFNGSQSLEFNAPTPKGSIDWQVLPNVMLFGSVTRGWKSGGTNYSAVSPATLSFRPETLLAYEGGLKSDWFGHRARLNLTGFSYDYDNLQIQDLLGPGNTAILNAANAKIHGIELETMAKPIPQLTLSFNYAYLDAKYGKFTAYSVPSTLVPYLAGDPRLNLSNPASPTYNATGNEMNNAPRSSFTFTAEYDQPVWRGKAFIRGSDYWQDKVYFDASNSVREEQRAYNLVDLSIGYTDTDGRWTAQVMARNLGNTEYLTAIAANGLAPSGLAGAPRTVAVQLTKSW